MRNPAKFLLLAGTISLLLTFSACDKNEAKEPESPKSTDTVTTAETVHEHAYGEWQVLTEPSCEEPGEQSKSCACGDTITETLAALGHTEQELAAVPATCTETGLEAGSQCKVCSAIVVEQAVIPAKGHTEQEIPAVLPTCTETGLGAGIRCEVCSVVLVEQPVLPIADHTEKILAGIAPTCTTAGLSEGKACSACNAVLTPQESLPATGHTEKVIDAVAPTCTAEGLTEGKACAVCDEVLTPQESIPTVEHTEVIDPAVAATCKATGLTQGKHCSACGLVITSQTKTSKVDHTAGNTCSMCGMNYFSVLKNYLIANGTKNTDSEDGTYYSVSTEYSSTNESLVMIGIYYYTNQQKIEFRFLISTKDWLGDPEAMGHLTVTLYNTNLSYDYSAFFISFSAGQTLDISGTIDASAYSKNGTITYTSCSTTNSSDIREMKSLVKTMLDGTLSSVNTYLVQNRVGFTLKQFGFSSIK